MEKQAKSLKMIINKEKIFYLLQNDQRNVITVWLLQVLGENMRNIIPKRDIILFYLRIYTSKLEQNRKLLSNNNILGVFPGKA